ncbi:MAG: hypothetical protein ACQCN6_06110 [Candidatus Bathyarchaeia archaeon]|jgi:uncharacterized Zn finger protein (UPF0148 family)
MASMEQKSPSGEPKHTPGHSTTVVIVSDGTFMCPECGKTFTTKDAAEEHLHGVHLEHLRNVHGEFHSKDVVGHHVE